MNNSDKGEGEREKIKEQRSKSREKNKKDGDVLKEQASSGRKSWEEKVREIK